MEARFGYDFSRRPRARRRARRGDGGAASTPPRSPSASDLVFGAGRYDPSGAGGPAPARARARARRPAVTRRRPGGGRGTRAAAERLRVARDPARDRGGHVGRPGAPRVPRRDRRVRARSRALRQRQQGAGDRPPLEGGESPASTCCRAQKMLLIREMLDGSDARRGRGGHPRPARALRRVRPARDVRRQTRPRLPHLESDINGDNRKRLDAFVADRFDGGREAVTRRHRRASRGTRSRRRARSSASTRQIARRAASTATAPPRSVVEIVERVLADAGRRGAAPPVAVPPAAAAGRGASSACRRTLVTLTGTPDAQ